VYSIMLVFIFMHKYSIFVRLILVLTNGFQFKINWYMIAKKED